MSPPANDQPDLWSDSVPNKGSILIIISSAFLAVSFLFVAARLLWRLTYKQKGWDDLLACLAFVTLVVQTSFGIVAASYGFGKHRSDVTRTFPDAMFWFYLYQICYKIFGTFTKLTFTCLYLRLFSKTQAFKKTVWGTTGVISAGGIAFTAGTIWQCDPVKRAWDRRVDGWCVDNLCFWYSHAAFNTFMDMVVFVLPMPLVGTLQMARKSKIGLISLFGLGFFTIIASIVRMVYLRGSARSAADPIWGSMPVLIWTEIESNTSMICCCLPALRKLGAIIWHQITGSPLAWDPHPSTSATPPEFSAAEMARSRLENENHREFGNFTTIRHSPQGSPVRPGRANRGRGSSPRPSKKITWAIGGRFARLLSMLRLRQPEEREQVELEEGRVSHLAPRIEGLEIYRDNGFRSDPEELENHTPAWPDSRRMSLSDVRTAQDNDEADDPARKPQAESRKESALRDRSSVRGRSDTRRAGATAKLPRTGNPRDSGPSGDESGVAAPKVPRDARATGEESTSDLADFFRSSCPGEDAPNARVPGDARTVIEKTDSLVDFFNHTEPPSDDSSIEDDKSWA